MIVRGFLVSLLFSVLALIAFGSVINGELITVDDPDQIHSLQQRDAWNLERTFVRNKTTGMYYRPLITLSFTADKLLWNADLRAMHLVNIALHTMNALMVLLLTSLLFGAHKYRWHFSLLGGILFLWHPLTAESVNWLSGRTDILAATFVFSSGLALLQFQKKKSWWWLVLSILLAVCGMLAKETAIAFFAGFGFLLWAQDRSDGLSFRKIVQRCILLFGLLTVAGGAACFMLFQLRELVLKDDSSRIGLTIRIMDSDWYHSLFVCLRALGFYFKKIFLPLPLNFSILEVDPLYELLAIPLLLLLVYLFVRRSMVAGYVLTGAVLVSPAFPIAFNQIAWAPYAERYVYISLGFVLPVIVFYLSRLTVKPKLCMAICGLLVFSSFVITFQRSWQWSINEALWADTVKKSPISEKAWNNYGVALLEQGRIDEAEKCFKEAASKYKFGYNDKYDINMAVAMMERHDYLRARKKLIDVVEQAKGNSDRAINVLLEIADEQGNSAPQVIQELRTGLKGLADNSESPAAYLYQLGRLEKHQNKKDIAQNYFLQAFTQAKVSDPIRKKAEKALEAK